MSTFYLVPEVREESYKLLRGRYAMAYSYKNGKDQTYYLHTRDVKLTNGRVQRIYFFARDVRPGSLDEVPAGYKVVETQRTGMPVLKKA